MTRHGLDCALRRTAGAVFLALGAACLLPVLFMLAGTFWHEGHPSLEHVIPALADISRTAVLLGNTLAVACVTVGTALLLGVPVGYLCFRTDLPCRGAIVIGCLVAACVPLHVTVTCWMALAGMQFWLGSAWAAGWIGGVAFAPLTALVTGICFAASDPDLEDAAGLDTGRRGVFRYVTLPAGSWGMAVAALTVIVLSMYDITITDILTVRTFGEEVFTQFQLGAGPWGATAVSLPVMGIVALAGYAAWRQLSRHGEATLSGVARMAPPVRLGSLRYPAICLVAAGFTGLYVLPLGALVRALGSPAGLVSAWRTAHEEIILTLWVTPLAATICAILAIVWAWMIVRNRRWRLPAAAGLLLLFATPGPVVGIGLIELLNRPGLGGAIYDSDAALVIAYIIRALPFGILAMIPAVKRIPREIEDCAELDGADSMGLIGRIVIPMCWRSIVVTWFLVFVLMVSEMGAAFLVVPPGSPVLTIRFFTLIHFGVYPDAAGICLILMGIVGFAGIVIAALVWPGLRRRFL